MLISTAFNGVKGTWFVLMDMAPITPLKNCDGDGKELEREIDDLAKLSESNILVNPSIVMLSSPDAPLISTDNHKSQHAGEQFPLEAQNEEEELERERGNLVKNSDPNCFEGHPGEDGHKGDKSNIIVTPHMLVSCMDSKSQLLGQELTLDCQLSSTANCGGEELEREREGLGKKSDLDNLEGQLGKDGPNDKRLLVMIGKPTRLESPSGGQLPIDSRCGEDELDRERGDPRKKSDSSLLEKVSNNLVCDGQPSGLKGNLPTSEELERERRNLVKKSDSDLFNGQWKGEKAGEILSVEKSASPDKKRHRKHKQKSAAHFSEFTDTQKVDQLGILGELCSQLLHNEKKKKKKKKNETDDQLSSKSEKIDFCLGEEAAQINPKEKTSTSVESRDEIESKESIKISPLDLNSVAVLTKDRKKSKSKNRVKILNPPEPEIVDNSKNLEHEERNTQEKTLELVTTAASGHNPPPVDQKALKSRKRQSEKLDSSASQPENVAISPLSNESHKRSNDRKRKSSNAEASPTSFSEKKHDDRIEPKMSEKCDEPKVVQTDSLRRSKRRLQNKKSEDVPQLDDNGNVKSVTGDSHQNVMNDDDLKRKDNANLEKLKERKATLPVASGDTTEDDSVNNKKNFRVALRKVRKSKSNSIVTKSDQEEIFLNTGDDTFSHLRGSSSDDDFKTKKNVSRKLEHSYPEDDTTPTLVIRGPKAQSGFLCVITICF